MLVEARRTNQADLSSLKTLSYGGAPIAPALLREALATFGEGFVQVYGSCEAPHPVLVMSRRDHRDADDRRLAPCDRLLGEGRLQRLDGLLPRHPPSRPCA